jgi:hypothetical protein
MRTRGKISATQVRKNREAQRRSQFYAEVPGKAFGQRVVIYGEVLITFQPGRDQKPSGRSARRILGQISARC